jgi:hypothetical protein
MTILSDYQQAQLKIARSMAWTRPFQIQTSPDQAMPDYYDTPSDTPSPTAQTVKGDYAWGPGLRYVGQYGLMIPEGTVMLCCDILHEDAVKHPRARLIIDAIPTAIVDVTRYPEFGEIVIKARRVDPPPP